MDINRLEEFVVLADNLNFSKAAKILFLTQPVLSRHINELEETLGDQLFIRDTHKVLLTPFGEMAAEQIRTVVDSYHEAMDYIRSQLNEVKGNIEVGFLGHAVRPFITQFTSYMKNEPDININYTSVAELDDLISMVENGDLDLGFITHIDRERSKDIESLWITDDPLCVVVPHKSPLAGRESVSISDLSGIPMITFDKKTNPHTVLFHERLFKMLGADLNSVRTVHNIESAFFYADTGLGAFIIPRHLLGLTQDLPVIPISDKEAYISLHLIWKNDNARPAVHTFIKDFKRFYDKVCVNSCS